MQRSSSIKGPVAVTSFVHTRNYSLHRCKTPQLSRRINPLEINIIMWRIFYWSLSSSSAITRERWDWDRWALTRPSPKRPAQMRQLMQHLIALFDESSAVPQSTTHYGITFRTFALAAAAAADVNQHPLKHLFIIFFHSFVDWLLFKGGEYYDRNAVGGEEGHGFLRVLLCLYCLVWFVSILFYFSAHFNWLINSLVDGICYCPHLFIFTIYRWF